MKYDNEFGYRALGLYADHEHVEVSKELLNVIINQILENCEKDDLDELDVHDHAVAGLMLLFMDVASSAGYIKLMRDIQDLSVEHGLSHLMGEYKL